MIPTARRTVMKSRIPVYVIHPRVSRHVTVVIVSIALLTSAPRAQKPSAAAVFDAFWAATSRDEAARRITPILQSGIGFDEVYRRLQRGRAYGPQPTGMIRL